MTIIILGWGLSPLLKEGRKELSKQASKQELANKQTHWDFQQINATMRSEVRAPSHVYDTSSPEEGESELQNVDDYFLTCGGKHPSLMQVPFWSKEMIWEISHTEKVHLQGKTEKGSSGVFCEVDSWKLQVPLEGKPRLLVRKVAGPWYDLTLISSSFSSASQQQWKHPQFQNVYCFHWVLACLNETK